LLLHLFSHLKIIKAGDRIRTGDVHLCRGEMSRTNFGQVIIFSSFCFVVIGFAELAEYFCFPVNIASVP
jgi:hypothetical protein